MKISQLINNLEDLKEEFGDIYVATTDYETAYVQENWDEKKYLCFGLNLESREIPIPGVDL